MSLKATYVRHQDQTGDVMVAVRVWGMCDTTCLHGKKLGPRAVEADNMQGECRL